MGPEFGKDAGKAAVIIRDLYGLKSAGAAFISHLTRCMESLMYESCKADLYLLLKPKIRPEDGIQYYFYLLQYVDDILYIHHNADAMLEYLHKSSPFKPGFGKADMYLGTESCKTRLHNGIWAWAMSPVKHA